MGFKRLIVGLRIDEAEIVLGAPYCGNTVVDISYKRDAITGVTSGAPDTYMYQVTTKDDDGNFKHSCFPFREVRRIDYAEIKEEEEAPKPEAVE